MAIDHNGNFIVCDLIALGGSGHGGLISVNPSTCAQAAVSANGFFCEPVGIAIVPAIGDADGDGVPDNIDQCPNTPLGTTVDANGCSIDQIVPCAGPHSGGPWRNHGQYVSSVAHVAEGFLQAGLITEAQKDAIVSEAARSKCGRR